MTTQQEDRCLRAATQLAEYSFIRKPGRVLVVKGTTRYTVTRDFCTCPDFETRCEPAGEKCKHQLMVELTKLLDHA